jgi:hypothetical protein
MRFRNVQFSSPETDRKVMLPVSFFVMALLWVLCATILIFIHLAADSAESFDWEAKHWVIVTALVVLTVVIIPIQLARYVRQMRASR